MTALTETGLIFVSTPENILGTVEVENACDKKPHPRNRKSDRGIARHVTLGMFIAFIAAVFGPIVAMQAWTIQVANEAKIAAAASRPYPYTSINAERDWDKHSEYHKDQHDHAVDEQTRILAHIEERLSGKIEHLPRPPERITKLLNEIVLRVTRLEVILNEVNRTN